MKSGTTATPIRVSSLFDTMATTYFIVLTTLLMLAGCGGKKSTSVTLTSITVTSASASIAPGTTTKFKASGSFSDGSAQDMTTSVVWSSSNGGVATVSNADGSKGTATAVAAGTATITATSGSVSGSAAFTPAALASIAVTPTNGTSIVTTTRQFKATGTLSGGVIQDLTSFVAWDSSDAAIATISTTGIASALIAGQTTIRATFDGISGSTPLNTATVTSIAVTPAHPAIAVGATRQFSAEGTLSNGATQDITSLVTWSSSSIPIATINAGGIASSLSIGSAAITAAFVGVSGTTTLTVQGPESIAVTPAKPSVVAGSTLQFTAKGTFADNSVQDLTTLVTWSSSDSAVATISSRGVATVKTAGSVTITATLGISGSTTMSAKSLASISVTPAAPTIGAGSTLQLAATGTFLDSSIQDLTASVTWGTVNPGVASISNAEGTKGLVTANTPGSTTITATFVGITKSITLTVNQSSRAYVANSGGNSLSVIDTTSMAVSTIAVGSGPWGVAVNASTNRVYVTNSGSNSLSVIDTNSNSVVATVGVGTGPRGVAVNPSTNRAYVANSSSGTLSVIDTVSNTAIATITVGTGPQVVALNPAASRAYVTNGGGNTLSVIDTTINTVVATIPVGPSPQGVALHPAASRAYVANSGSNSLSVIDTVSNAVITTVIVANGPRWIAANPAANRIYVSSSSNNNTLTAIDTVTNTTAAIIAVGSLPEGVAVNPGINRVYVVNSGSNTLTVINTVNNSAVATIGVGVGPRDVAVIP